MFVSLKVGTGESPGLMLRLPNKYSNPADSASLHSAAVGSLALLHNRNLWS